MSVQLTCTKCGAFAEIETDGMPFVTLEHAANFVLLFMRGKACRCTPHGLRQSAPVLTLMHPTVEA